MEYDKPQYWYSVIQWNWNAVKYDTSKWMILMKAYTEVEQTAHLKYHSMMFRKEEHILDY